MRRKDARPRACARAVLICLLVSPIWAGDLNQQVRVNADTVRHQADDGTARSDNFYVTAPAGDFLADRVLQAAERHRREIARTWLGHELPAGDELTFIHVDVCDDCDVGLAMLDDARAELRNRIWLRTSAERATGTTLAHEIAHIVLSARFPIDMPVWATEGVSCQYDDTPRIDVRREIISRFVRTQRWPPLADLLAASSIRPTDEVSYAAAVSVTEYLITLADRPTFLQFVGEGRRTGWDAALRQNYSIASVDELSRDWRRWATRRSERQSVAPVRQVDTTWVAIGGSE